MRRRRRKSIILCLVGCMLAMFTGCGSTSKYMDNMAADTAPMESYTTESYAVGEMGGGYLEYAVEEEMDAEMPEAGAPVSDSAASVQSERKLIKTVDMDVETKEFDKVMATLEEQIAALGGYIENMETYNGSTYSYYRHTRNASLTARIPKDKLNGFLETVSCICNVVRRSENVEDVTLAYVDLESHKNALRTEQTRLLELLEKAETIEDIITIEQRLSNVRYELESMESQLRTYDNKVDYSTVYLYIDEVEELTPIVEETAWERMVNGFKESIEDIGDGFKEFGIWFVVNIPYLVIWAVVIVVAVVVIRKMGKKRKAKKQAKTQQVASGEKEA